MLGERDKKALRFSSEHPFLALYAVWIAPAMFLVFAALQLSIAGELSAAAHRSLAEVVELWFSGADPAGRYSGVAVSAILRVERAFSMFCIALTFGGLAAVAGVFRGREQRLSALLVKAQE